MKIKTKIKAGLDNNCPVTVHCGPPGPPIKIGIY
jgi:hypothetical protein